MDPEWQFPYVVERTIEKTEDIAKGSIQAPRIFNQESKTFPESFQ